MTTVPEDQSSLEQQQDPRGDLLKARPGGKTEPGGPVPPYSKEDAKENAKNNG